MRSSPVLCVLCVLLPFSGTMAGQSGNPVAAPGAVVTAGDVRFTVLTDRLLRMEWAPGGSFEDHASLVFINRALPVPAFTRTDDGDRLVISTGALTLSYKRDTGKFTSDNLAVRFRLDGKDVIWHPGLEDKGNLRGTTRTLDGVEGSTDLEPGLLSRDGWVLIDDSARPLYDNSDWPWVMERSGGEHQDLYFFGYGHSYKDALGDFTKVAGKIPMPPRFAFGTWWSRYWAYTDQEFKELVDEFHAHNVPLDVLVIDMDWHQIFTMRWGKRVLDQAGQQLGWTGYTWDKNFFPDPAGFLRWCETQGLKTPLNVHPASGIQPHEDHYPDMARAMGIDPASKKYVPFAITDKKFASHYLDLIIRPLERQGVDFWWLDWQAWGTTAIPGVTPTWWLNYVFFTDMERRNQARPLLFHRWGGLGNHRYQIGFSGDAISVWPSLAFQPYFTSTAANVGFGYWSHDIGGHMPGPISPELYTRWIQFGIFSPIVRTHTTKRADAERRIWGYPDQYYEIMRDAFLLRYAMIPYIYTASREAYETGVAICRPMYYDHPGRPEAYEWKDQYMFGDDILVAPVATPMDPDSLAAVKSVWLPEGEWIEWSTGARLRGPNVLRRSFALDEMPVYVKAGAIIPMQPPMDHVGGAPVDPLILTLFPGEKGAVRVYEDQGNSLGYQRGEYAVTQVSDSVPAPGHMVLRISAAEGRYPGMPLERAYELRLPGSLPPDSVMLGSKVLRWRYDGEKFMTVVAIPPAAVTTSMDIDVWTRPLAPGERNLVAGAAGVLARLRRVMPLINNAWPKEWSPDDLVAAVQTGNRIGLRPETAREELMRLHAAIPAIMKQVEGLNVGADVKGRVLAHLAACAGW